MDKQTRMRLKKVQMNRKMNLNLKTNKSSKNNHKMNIQTTINLKFKRSKVQSYQGLIKVLQVQKIQVHKEEIKRL